MYIQIVIIYKQYLNRKKVIHYWELIEVNTKDGLSYKSDER